MWLRKQLVKKYQCHARLVCRRSTDCLNGGSKAFLVNSAGQYLEILSGWCDDNGALGRESWKTVGRTHTLWQRRRGQRSWAVMMPVQTHRVLKTVRVYWIISCSGETCITDCHYSKLYTCTYIWYKTLVHIVLRGITQHWLTEVPQWQSVRLFAGRSRTRGYATLGYQPAPSYSIQHPY